MTLAATPPGPDAAAPTPPPSATSSSHVPWQVVHPPPPDGRALVHGRPAGVVTRVTANAVDVALVLLAVALVYAGWSGLRLLISPESYRLSAPALEWGGTAVGIGLVLYWTTTWAGSGRTHGDQLMGLRVVSRHGARLHVLHAAARALFCVLFLPGLLWVLVSRRNQSVQDILLRTAVVYD